MINEHALASAPNVNLDFIKRSFSNFEPFLNDITANFTNDFCLMCINAYDLSKNNELLKLADHIYSSFKGQSLDKNIVLINQYQINFRLLGTLTDKEIEELIKSKQQQPENIELQFCTSVLLESKRESKLHFNQFDSDKQKFYEKLPIYKLYEQLIEA